jgi:hypothetical protein
VEAEDLGAAEALHGVSVPSSFPISPWCWEDIRGGPCCL